MLTPNNEKPALREKAVPEKVVVVEPAVTMVDLDDDGDDEVEEVEEVKLSKPTKVSAKKAKLTLEDDDEDDEVSESKAAGKLVKFQFNQLHTFQVGSEINDMKKGDKKRIELHVANLLSSRNIGFIIGM